MRWLSTALFPPYPSPGFDARLSNYLNNLDLTELPSGIVSISTTNACPYSCAFCSTNAKRKTMDDLDEDLLKKTITYIEDLGTPTLILHGGEPFYRYDRFLRLVKHVRDQTCLWMFTTGYGVTRERAEELRENGLFGVWVSLDHHTPEVHNRLRGHAQAFENACNAVEHFKKAGVYTCLSLVPPDDLLEPENFKQFYDFAKDLGVAEIRVMEKKPSGREACRGVVPHSPVLEQLQKDLYHDPAFADHPPLSGLSTWLEKDAAFGCQCRFEYLFVTSTGDVQPCEVSEISFGNINEEEFSTDLQTNLQRVSRSCDRLYSHGYVSRGASLSEGQGRSLHAGQRGVSGRDHGRLSGSGEEYRARTAPSGPRTSVASRSTGNAKKYSIIQAASQLSGRAPWMRAHETVFHELPVCSGSSRITGERETSRSRT